MFAWAFAASRSMQLYARDFPVVEVQSTVYKPPRDATMRQWLAATGAGLEYTMKVWQLVTHPVLEPDLPAYETLCVPTL